MTLMEIAGIKQNLLSYIRSSTRIKFRFFFENMQNNLEEEKNNTELGIN